MAKTVDLGAIADRLKATADKLSAAPFQGTTEIVDHHVVLRAQLEDAGRGEAHSEVVPLIQLFLVEKDVLAEALARLERWAAERVARSAA